MKRRGKSKKADSVDPKAYSNGVRFFHNTRYNGFNLLIAESIDFQ